MSPKDIKLNYFFNDPAVKENMLSEYLHYSIEDDIYTEVVEEGYVATDDFSQNSTFSEQGDAFSEFFFQKDKLMAVHDAGRFEWANEQKENVNAEQENEYNIFFGDHHSDV